MGVGRLKFLKRLARKGTGQMIWRVPTPRALPMHLGPMLIEYASNRRYYDGFFSTEIAGDRALPTLLACWHYSLAARQPNVFGTSTDYSPTLGERLTTA